MIEQPQKKRKITEERRSFQLYYPCGNHKQSLKRQEEHTHVRTIYRHSNKINSDRIMLVRQLSQRSRAVVMAEHNHQFAKKVALLQCREIDIMSPAMMDHVGGAFDQEVHAIAGLVLLHHHPHALDEITGVPPIALGVQITDV